jgi:hypothetical protein
MRGPSKCDPVSAERRILFRTFNQNCNWSANLNDFSTAPSRHCRHFALSPRPFKNSSQILDAITCRAFFVNRNLAGDSDGLLVKEYINLSAKDMYNSSAIHKTRPILKWNENAMFIVITPRGRCSVTMKLHSIQLLGEVKHADPCLDTIATQTQMRWREANE